MTALCVLTAMLLLAADHGAKGVRWTFEDARLGQLPKVWSAAKTGQGPGSLWRIVADETAPKGPNVLAQTSSQGPRPLFNLCVLNEGTYGDMDITVSFKAVAGKIDRGGGPVWRYQDANNYYICRHNPLENNFRIYKVIKGKRMQLASADSKAAFEKWHTIKVSMRKDKIVCSINGRKLEVRDDTITKAGKVGLWTKADAVTYFDDTSTSNRVTSQQVALIHCERTFSMSSLSRRNFLFASSGAAAGSILVPELAAAAEDHQHFAHSGLVTGKPKPLRHKAIPGFLSFEQIAPHYTAHYGGALRGYSAADTKLEESIKTATAIDSNTYGAIQRARQSKGNSVILHELYFDGLVPKASDPTADVRSAIEKRFGSIDKWADDFQASAKAAAGWAMLVLHPVNGKLYNVISDEHAHGPLWMAVPLVVIDVYEHAFYIDYQNRKAEYVERFSGHIDWAEVNARYRLA